MVITSTLEPHSTYSQHHKPNPEFTFPTLISNPDPSVRIRSYGAHSAKNRQQTKSSTGTGQFQKTLGKPLQTRKPSHTPDAMSKISRDSARELWDLTRTNGSVSSSTAVKIRSHAGTNVGRRRLVATSVDGFNRYI
ncbi:unnamed protein product [Fusarium venenatum]|uniref:Uncharacterized protein n=1 Tax=Fusarium venenatum TaxID=56646 RepID=A0A2L2TQB0_9HYPO|nr:uncharacterized protein FVRRES_02208 [Fusarium venenatum]CEI65696.1 unnamed protein product [Fusarium venenatum]